ncbi:unnamed protein product, partial [Prorocentrum cordatum]
APLRCSSRSPARASAAPLARARAALAHACVAGGPRRRPAARARRPRRLCGNAGPRRGARRRAAAAAAAAARARARGPGLEACAHRARGGGRGGRGALGRGGAGAAAPLGARPRLARPCRRGRRPARVRGAGRCQRHSGQRQEQRRGRRRGPRGGRGGRGGGGGRRALPPGPDEVRLGGGLCGRRYGRRAGVHPPRAVVLEAAAGGPVGARRLLLPRARQAVRAWAPSGCAITGRDRAARVPAICGAVQLPVPGLPAEGLRLRRRGARRLRPRGRGRRRSPSRAGPTCTRSSTRLDAHRRGSMHTHCLVGQGADELGEGAL